MDPITIGIIAYGIYAASKSKPAGFGPAPTSTPYDSDVSQFSNIQPSVSPGLMPASIPQQLAPSQIVLPVTVLDSLADLKNAIAAVDAKVQDWKARADAAVSILAPPSYADFVHAYNAYEAIVTDVINGTQRTLSDFNAAYTLVAGTYAYVGPYADAWLAAKLAKEAARQKYAQAEQESTNWVLTALSNIYHSYSAAWGSGFPSNVKVSILLAYPNKTFQSIEGGAWRTHTWKEAADALIWASYEDAKLKYP